ncbi:MAG: 50S ribosomal protein L32e [Candidatus Thermoplasmatota archaeon]|nr:50S ribosomal protein L32e [Candidatus Thermoplasmatota archaeon]
MTSKEEMVKTLTSLKGIGKVKAEAIINAGFDTLKKIQHASIEELCEVNGISESVATSIKDQILNHESIPSDKKEKTEKKVEEKKEKKEPVVATPSTVKPQKEDNELMMTGAPEGYVVKKKPTLTKELFHDLSVRKEKKKKTPRFLREEWFRYKRISKNWRRPDGITSKMRINKKYRPSRVRVGFRGPKNVRGLHPSGFEEVLVYNVSDLESINAGVQAARIAGTVGTKKRVAIAEKAKELDIRLLNK